MKFCDHCFSQIDDNEQFCKECGAPMSGDPTAESSDSVVYPEIARANLFRLRGGFQEAEKVLLAVLKRYPGNTTSQIMIGDLNVETGEHRQALQWYNMASDIAKDTQGLQAKIDRVRAAIEKEEASIATSDLQVKTSSFPFMFIAFIAGVVVIVSAGAFWVAGSRAKNQELDRLDKIAQPISINQPAGPISKSNPSASDPTNDAPVPIATGTPGLTSSENDLLSSLTRQLANGSISIDAITVDPRTSAAAVTCSSQSTEDAVVTIARVADGLVKMDGSLLRVVVRVLDPASRKLLCIGTVEATALVAATGEPGSADWAASVVTEVWKP